MNKKNIDVVINKWWVDVKEIPAPKDDNIKKFCKDLKKELKDSNLEERFETIKTLLNSFNFSLE